MLLLVLWATPFLQLHPQSAIRVEKRMVAPGVVDLTFVFPPLHLEDIPEGDGTQRVRMEGARYIQLPGEPELPFFTHPLEVLVDTGVSAQLLQVEEEELTGLSLALSRGPRMRSGAFMKMQEDASPQAADYFPERFYSLGTPHTMRGTHGQVLQLFPCRYDASRGMLRVARRITLRVEGLIPSQARLRGAPLGKDPFEGDLVVVTRGKYLKTLARFIHWKRMQGRGVKVLLYGEDNNAYPSVHDTVEMMGWLRSQYQALDSRFKYLLLVGSRDEVPPLHRWGASKRSDSDQSWGELEGNDAYNEVCVGRFSCYDTGQLATQVDRTIYYERDLPTGSKWLTQGVLVASNEGGTGEGDNGESDREHANGIRSLLLGHGYSAVDTLYDLLGQPATKEQLIDRLNAGVGVMGYTGHGRKHKWVTTGFSVDDVPLLSNHNQCPYIFNTACKVGLMESAAAPCLAERLMWAKSGSSIVGSVGMTASSDDQWWDPPMLGQDAMFNYLTGKQGGGSVHTLGEVTTLAMAHMMDGYDGLPGGVSLGTMGKSTKDTWNIFGDPSLLLRTEDANTIEAIIPGWVFTDAKELLVKTPERALSAMLSIGRVDGSVEYISGTPQASGYSFQLPPLAEDDRLSLSVSGVNRETLYRETIPVKSSASRVVKLGAVQLFSRGAEITNTVRSGADIEVKGSLCLEQSLPSNARVEVRVASFPSDAILTVGGGGGNREVTSELVSTPVGNCTSSTVWFPCELSTALHQRDKVFFVVSLLLDGVLLESKSFNLEVVSSELRFIGFSLVESPGASASPNGIVEAGDAVQLSLNLQNHGGVESDPLDVEVYWLDGAGQPLQGVQQGSQQVASVAAGSSVEVTQQMVAPDPENSFLAGLGFRVSALGKVLLTERLPLRYGEPLSAPAQNRRLNYPFGSKGSDCLFSQLFDVAQLKGLLGVGNGQSMASIVGLSLPVQLNGLDAVLPSSVKYLFHQGSRELSLAALSEDERLKVVESMKEALCFVEDGVLHLEFPVETINPELPLQMVLFVAGDDPRQNYSCEVSQYASQGVVAYGVWKGNGASTQPSWEPWLSLPAWHMRVPEVVSRKLMVVETDGSPIPSAAVFFNGNALQTDADGIVLLKGLEGNYSLEAESKYHRRVNARVDLSKIQTGLFTLELTRVDPMSVTLLVRDANNREIPEVHVSIDGVLQSFRSNGYYIIPIPVGRHELELTSPGYDTLRDEIDVVKNSMENVHRYRLQVAPSTPTAVSFSKANDTVLDVQAWPNPCRESLSLNCVANFEYGLFSPVGHLLMQGKGMGGEVTTLNLEGLACGVYLLRVCTLEGDYAVVRVVKEY